MHFDTTAHADAVALFSGPGEVRSLARALDWSQTPMGPTVGWSPAIRTLARSIFDSPFPICLWSGPQYALLYNDAYRRILAAKHPVALGQPGSIVWAEIWEQLKPQFDGVRAGGEPIYFEDAPFEMARLEGGGTETAWFNYSLSALRDEDGSVAAILNITPETTDRVLLGRRLAEEQAALAAIEAAAKIDAQRVQLALAAGAIVGTWFWDIPGDRFTSDEPFAGAFGLDPIAAREGIPLADVFATVHPDDRAGLSAAIEAATARGGAYVHQYRVRRSEDDDYHWIEANGRVDRAADGTPSSFPGVLIDIGQRRQAEAALRASEEFARRVLESSVDCIKVLDLDAHLEFMSEGGMCVMEVDDFGVIEGACWPDLWLGDEHAKAVAAVDEAKRGGIGRFQGFATTMKGTPRWWDVAVTPISGADGAPVKLLSVSRDVTEQREAAERLRELNDTLERRVAERTAERDRMWEASPDLMLAIDFDGVFRQVNPAWTTLLGYGAQELVGHHVNEFVLPDDHHETTDAYELAASGGRPVMVNRYRHKDGSIHWISWTAAPAADMTYATGRDITDQRRQAAELAERTAELERNWRLLQDLLVIVELDGSFAAVNAAWTKALGWSEQELVGKTFMELAHPDDVEPTLERFKAVFETPLTEPYEYRLRHKNGRYRWIAWTAAFHGGRVFANGRDVTERREREAELEAAQEALRQSQKMEAMGSLTGGVAHDFNNLLTPIIGSLDMLVRKGVGSERERRLIDGALQSAERAKTLVQRLLAFARRQPLQPVAVDVGRLVDGMAALIGSTLGPTIDVRVDLGDDLPPAQTDPNQLEMALLNLAVNARDAMPDGGELIIAAKRESVRGIDGSGLKLGHYIRLCVTDNGIGMDQATLARAIEPFFSTKGIGKGTGLGLSMVHGLSAQLGGGLTIASTPGEGTSIALWLPISATSVGADEDTVAPSMVRMTRGTALLVDDEELVRMSTADMLIDLGFEVVEAGSAELALELIRAGTAPDLLVTDHLMQGMNGTELAREVRAIKPELLILIVSGYAEVDGIAPELPRLTKPFRNVELQASLAALIPALEY